jgi:hypothetical protein
LKTSDQDEPLTVIPVLAWWVRIGLVLIALALLSVFVVAAMLNPYHDDGSPRTSETHTTAPLYLPKCSFKVATGLPCPSCGMTTSFTHLTHAFLEAGRTVGLTAWGEFGQAAEAAGRARDGVGYSLQANAVGTVLALACLALIPWGIVSAWRARPTFVLTVERPLVIGVVALVTLMLIRWGIVLLMHWWSAGG